jgi:hypothetical protein
MPKLNDFLQFQHILHDGSVVRSLKQCILIARLALSNRLRNMVNRIRGDATFALTRRHRTGARQL